MTSYLTVGALIGLVFAVAGVAVVLVAAAYQTWLERNEEDDLPPVKDKGGWVSIARWHEDADGNRRSLSQDEYDGWVDDFLIDTLRTDDEAG